MLPDHVYIIISTKFEHDRFEYLLNFFKKNDIGIPVTFFEAIYKDEDKIDKGKYYFNLTLGEKCLTQTFLNLFKHIISNNHNSVLILESDCLFEESFREDFYRVMDDYSKIMTDRDMIFFGNACKFVPKPSNHRIGSLYLENSSSCADSMFMRINTVKSILDYMDNIIISKPIDHLLNDIILSKNINAYWCIPELITQGSVTGAYKSSLR